MFRDGARKSMWQVDTKRFENLPTQDQMLDLAVIGGIYFKEAIHFFPASIARHSINFNINGKILTGPTSTGLQRVNEEIE